MIFLHNLLVGILIILLHRNVEGTGLLIETNVGKIKGVRATDGNYSMFLGIPFAEVNPDNPFGPATIYPVFNETFVANDDLWTCPQYDSTAKAGIGSLDCLRLNIHVPDTASPHNLLPVIVAIYGGAFKTGYAGRREMGPQFLVRHDVIFVTFNYRTSVYGFMCLGTTEVPGNQGIRDQLIALRWIKSNIKAFGGDPDAITLMGQSAGGRSIDIHLMRDENLFSKAIIESATSLSQPGLGGVNTTLPIVLANNLGNSTNDYLEAVAFLKTLEPLSVVTIAEKLGVTFKLCVEKKLDGVEILVPDYTINRKVPKVKTTPLLIGFNNNEKYFDHYNKDNSSYKGMANFFGDLLQKDFTFDYNRQDKLQKLIRTFYIGDEEISVNVKQNLSDCDSDFTYIHPVHRSISNYLANGAIKIYHYMFSYEGERNFYKIIKNVTATGALHKDELGYLFGAEILSQIPTPADQTMIDRMTTMWTNFAKYGDPTPNATELLPVKWEPISDLNWYYYDLGNKISLKHRPLNQRMTFLDLFFEMNKEFQIGFRDMENRSNTYNTEEIYFFP